MALGGESLHNNDIKTQRKNILSLAQDSAKTFYLFIAVYSFSLFL